MSKGPQQVTIAGVELEFWDSGTGTPILFLHGGDGIEGVEEFVDHLGGQYRVITPSHPGFGGSSLPDHYSDVSDLGFFYLDLIDHLKLRDIIVVGASFGAWIAADMATKNTSRIKGLVLAGAVGAKFSDRRTREIRDLFSMPRQDVDQWLVSTPERQQIDRTEWAEETLVRAARNHESFALFAWSPTLYDPKLKHRLHRIDVPTQVIWGEQDRVVPVEYGRRIAEGIAQAQFEVTPGAGHYVHRDDPKRFAASIDAFAARLKPTE